MVAGKDTKGLTQAAKSAARLPPVPKLRVRRPDSKDQNPCIGVMSTVLGTSSTAEPQKQMEDLDGRG